MESSVFKRLKRAISPTRRKIQKRLKQVKRNREAAAAKKRPRRLTVAAALEHKAQTLLSAARKLRGR